MKKLGKNQQFINFKGLSEEEVEKKIQELVDNEEIISLSVVPEYTQGGTGNFLAPKVSFRYTIYAIVKEEKSLWTMQIPEDNWGDENFGKRAKK